MKKILHALAVDPDAFMKHQEKIKIEKRKTIPVTFTEEYSPAVMNAFEDWADHMSGVYETHVSNICRRV